MDPGSPGDYFMQNKANFRKAKMKLNSYSTKDYENETAFGLWENKPNQSQSQKQKSEDRSRKTEVRRQKTEGRRQKSEDRRQTTEGRVQSSALRHPPSALCCGRQREEKICIGKEL